MHNPFKVDEEAQAIGEALDLFQIKEKGGEIWITYQGNAVVPESLLKKSALESLLEIRERYVKFKSNSQNAKT